MDYLLLSAFQRNYVDQIWTERGLPAHRRKYQVPTKATITSYEAYVVQQFLISLH